MERPEALESGSIIMTGLNPDNQCAASLLTCHLIPNPAPEGCGSDEFSSKVLRYLFSTCSSAKTCQGKIE
jgi:hypothetical protein